MRYSFAVLVVALMAGSCSRQSTEPGDGFVADQMITVDGSSRVYDIYAPDGVSSDTPLIVLLHGNRGSRGDLMGTGRAPAPFAQWQRIADAEGLFLLIPQGEEGTDGNTGWNDCRLDAAGNSTADDVGFITAAIDEVGTTYELDLERIYAVGISNGGHMAQRLADEAAERIDGIAVIAAGAPVNSSCEPSSTPISALFMWGTADPLAPYEGGAMAGGRGEIFSADETVARWLARNGITATPTVTAFDDQDTADDSTVERLLYSGGIDDTAVALYRVDGGGHIEPSIEAQYGRLFERLVGRQNHDIEMADQVWEFFASAR